MSRIKIVHIVTRMVVGGAQETALVMCSRASGEKYEQTLVVGGQTGIEGDLFAEARNLKVRVLIVPSLVRELSPLKDARATFDIVRFLRRERPAVVHTHSSKAGVLGRVAAKCARVPIVVHSVHGWSFNEHMGALARNGCIATERMMARLTDCFVVENASDGQKGLDNHIGKRGKYVTIRNGVRVERFEGSGAARMSVRNAVRGELGISQNAVIVGSVMRLTDQKNPVGFVRAAALVAAKHPKVEFVIVGDGPLRTRTEEAAGDLGLGGRVKVTGVRRDIPRMLAAFDMFSLASRWEGLPIALLEAMAAGLPVVVPRVNGLSEAVEDGISGTLVEPDDPRCLADGISDLIENPAKAVGFSNAGRERVREMFDSRRMVDQLEELYGSLYEHGARGPG